MTTSPSDPHPPAGQPLTDAPKENRWGKARAICAVVGTALLILTIFLKTRGGDQHAMVTNCDGTPAAAVKVFGPNSEMLTTDNNGLIRFPASWLGEKVFFRDNKTNRNYHHHQLPDRPTSTIQIELPAPTPMIAVTAPLSD